MPSHSLIILLSRLDSFPNPLYTRLMLARVYSCAVIGLDGVIVEVEVDTGEGLPSMVLLRTPSRCLSVFFQLFSLC